MNAGIVIPVLNQLEFTRGCLDSLAGDIANGAEVVVVDNGSANGSGEFLATQRQIKLIRNAENRGCAAAWNQGVKAASRDWIMILNNDVLVSKGWLAALIAFAEDRDVDIASPAIREGELNYDFPSYANAFTGKMSSVTRWKVANGISFLVRRRVFDKVGLFDENFRIGQFEDKDFFWRARQAGFRLATTGCSFIHHFGSVTQDAVRRERGVRPYEAENRAYFRQKWKIGWWRRRRQRIVTDWKAWRWRSRERALHGHTLYEKWIAGRLCYF